MEIFEIFLKNLLSKVITSIKIKTQNQKAKISNAIKRLHCLKFSLDIFILLIKVKDVKNSFLHPFAPHPPHFSVEFYPSLHQFIYPL